METSDTFTETVNTFTEDNTYVTDKINDNKDLERVANALCAYADTQPLSKLVSRTKVLKSIKEMFIVYGCIRFIRSIKDDSLLGAFAYAIGSDWWTEGDVMAEVFVVTVNPRCYGIGRIAGKHMIKIAHQNNVKLIQSGSLLAGNHKLINNLYVKKLNFDKQFCCYYKTF